MIISLFLLVVLVLLPFLDGKRLQKRHTEEISFAAKDGVVIDSKGRNNRKKLVKENNEPWNGQNLPHLSTERELDANSGLESTPEGGLLDSTLFSEPSIEAADNEKDLKKKNKAIKSTRGKLAKTEGGSTVLIPEGEEEQQKSSMPTKLSPEEKRKKYASKHVKDTEKGNEDSEVKREENSEVSSSTEDGEEACPPCPSEEARVDQQLKKAVLHFWMRDYITADNCACHVLKKNRKDQLALSVSRACWSSGTLTQGTGKRFGGPKIPPPLYPVYWEVLGPIPAGKLEVDGDPSFDSHLRAHSSRLLRYATNSSGSGGMPSKQGGFEPILHLLILPTEIKVYSELVNSGYISWKRVAAKEPGGAVDVRFPEVNWNELTQGTANTAVSEFQGWARATTYAYQDGVFGLHCQGVHTVYVHNDGATRMLSGDVYRSGTMITAVELKVGPVAIVVPLRGASQATFVCHIAPEPTEAAESIVLLPPRDVPHLVSLPPSGGGQPRRGMLLSSLFTLPVHNTAAHPVSIQFGVKAPKDVPGSFQVTPVQGARHNVDRKSVQGGQERQRATVAAGGKPVASPPVVVAPGQLALVPLDLSSFTVGSNGVSSTSSKGSRESHEAVFLPCRKGLSFTLTATPTRGAAKEAILDLTCRHSNQSFLFSYLDVDGSVSQAAVLFPLLRRGTVTHASFLEDELEDASPGRSMTQAQESLAAKQRSKRKRKASVDIQGLPSDEHDTTSKQQVAGGHGNIQAGARIIPASAEELQLLDAQELTSRADDEREVAFDQASDALRRLREASQECSGDDCNIYDDEYGDGAYVDYQNTDEYMEGGVGEEESTEMEERERDEREEQSKALEAFPVLLSLHGTGTSALAQADAYKMKPQSRRLDASKEYTFGVEGYWVVAPDRFGAHNWEGIGELSAQRSVPALGELLSCHPWLPQLHSDGGGILAGHSMGGHGAWMSGVNSPDQYACVVSASSWLSKEKYHSSNAFFELDVQGSYVEPALKVVMEVGLQEYQVDSLASNLRSLQRVHLRVGSSDYTTHPYFSRRMHRVLAKHGVNSTLEEVPGKQHWWWDTRRENDGGVLNDAKMRSLYGECLKSSYLLRREDEERRNIDRALYKKMQGWEWEDEDEDEDSSEEEMHGQEERDTGDDEVQPTSSEGDTSSEEQEELRLREMEEKARMDKLLGSDLRRNRKEDVNFLPSSASQAGQSLIDYRRRANRARAKRRRALSERQQRNRRGGGRQVEIAPNRLLTVAVLRDATIALNTSHLIASLLPAPLSLPIDRPIGKRSCRLGIFTVEAVNPAHSRGACGVRILQQFATFRESKVDVRCQVVDAGSSITTTPTTTDSASSYTLLWGEVMSVDEDGKPLPETVQQRRRRRRKRSLELEELEDVYSQQRCDITTSNVRRLAFSPNGPSSAFSKARLALTTMYLNGKRLSLATPQSDEDETKTEFSVDVCFSKRNVPSRCSLPIIPGVEKSPEVHGPVRDVHTRPFLIVYGTPRDQRLRQTLRDIAVYLGNSYAAAHQTYVRVITDLEYRAGKYALQEQMWGLVLVGGPAHNKVSATLLTSARPTQALWLQSELARHSTGHNRVLHSRNISTTQVRAFAKKVREAEKAELASLDKAVPLVGHSQVHFESHNNGEKAAKRKSARNKKGADTFTIGHKVLDERHAAIFTAPFSRRGYYVDSLLGSTAPSISATIAANATNYSVKRLLQEVVRDTQAALGVVLHAPSSAAYLQLARLAWPVVPPMVRAPFAHYMPDFVVLKGESAAVWEEGLAAVEMGGYFDGAWGFDPAQAFS